MCIPLYTFPFADSDHIKGVTAVTAVTLYRK